MRHPGHEGPVPGGQASTPPTKRCISCAYAARPVTKIAEQINGRPSTQRSGIVSLWLTRMLVWM